MDTHKTLLFVCVAAVIYYYLFRYEKKTPRPKDEEPNRPTTSPWIEYDNPVAGATSEFGAFLAANCFNTALPLINHQEWSKDGHPPWSILLWISESDTLQRVWLDLAGRLNGKTDNRVRRIRIINTSLAPGVIPGDDGTMHGAKNVRIYLLRDRPSNAYGADSVAEGVMLFEGIFPRNAEGSMDFVELDLRSTAPEIVGRYLVLDIADAHSPIPGFAKISLRRVQVVLD
jgi:hypothetical protein